MKIAAIYVIVNKINHKIYLGSTNDFKGRFSRHFNELRHDNHDNEHLQSAFNKYGEESFIMFPVEEFSKISRKLLLEKETYYIKKYNLTNKRFGYNINPNPVYPPNMPGKNNPNWKGGPVKVFCVQCGNMFEVSRGNYNQNKKRGRKSYCSRKCKDKAESKRMLGCKIALGCKHSTEANARKSKRMSGKKHPMYDKHHTDATIKKIQLARQNISDEIRKRMSNTHKGQLPWNKDGTNVYSRKRIEEIRDRKRDSLGRFI